MSDIFQYMQLTQFTPGRAQFALSQVVESGAASTSLMASIKQAVEGARVSAELDGRWRTRKAQPEARGQAQVLDAQLDRTVGALFVQLTTRRDLYGERHPMGAKVGEFLLRHMPGGAQAITLLSYEDEVAAVTRLLEALGGDGAEVVEVTQVSWIIEQMAGLLPLMKAELVRKAAETITFDEVRTARVKMQRGLLRVVAGIIGTHGGTDDAETFGRLMGPIEFQAERIKALRRGRRRVVDVDPGTGGEVLTEEEV